MQSEADRHEENLIEMLVARRSGVGWHGHEFRRDDDHVLGEC